MTKKESCEAIAQQIIEDFGSVDILINNAGITQPIRIMDVKPENYDAVVDVSLRGMLYLTQAFIPHFISRGGGSIACTSSVSAQTGGGFFGGPHYSAAKAGMLGLAKDLARELGPKNIRVNAVAPGMDATDIRGDKIRRAFSLLKSRPEDQRSGCPAGERTPSSLTPGRRSKARCQPRKAPSQSPGCVWS